MKTVFFFFRDKETDQFIVCFRCTEYEHVIINIHPNYLKVIFLSAYMFVLSSIDASIWKLFEI